ncbi:MAG: hypothetical protein ABSH48_28050, partial [Verrucomicrobiota bacterium]
GATSREDWLNEIWLALSKSQIAQPLIFEFIACLAINCSTQPAVFFGILNNAMLENPYIYRIRGIVFTDVAVAANTMSRLAKQGFPFWPKLAQDWLEHRVLNDTLARLGVLDSRSFDSPTPAKKIGKHANNKSRRALLKAKRRLRQKHRKFVRGRPSISLRGQGNFGTGSSPFVGR